MKGWMHLIGAMFALAAGIAWFVASRHPVGVPGSGVYAPRELSHPFWKSVEAMGNRIRRGAGRCRIISHPTFT